MGRASVLVVDDEEGMVETLADILAATGYRVATASSGEAALAMLRQGPYDVVLMDILMPGLSGVEALHAMKAVTPGLPVIMMTAFTGHKLVAAARAAAVAVLAKPLDLDEVFALIDQVATRERARAP